MKVSIPKLFVLGLLLFVSSSYAVEQCGTINGERYCVSEPGCGVVNGVATCGTPAGCGYVNGIYTCVGETGFDAPTPLPSGENELAKPGPYDAAASDGIQWLSGWFNSWSEGDTGFFGRAYNWVIQKAIVYWLEMKLAFMQMGWSIAKGVLGDLGVFDQLQQAFSGLSADVLSVLNFFGIPQAINILITGGMTRFILRFLPGG